MLLQEREVTIGLVTIIARLFMPGLFISYSVSAARLCPDARRGRKLTRCGRESAPPHFTLEMVERPGVVWLLSTTICISSLGVTCLPVFVFLQLCSCVYAVLEASWV
jgi:hypothetical protein